jgi:hypothetical protein
MVERNLDSLNVLLSCSPWRWFGTFVVFWGEMLRLPVVEVYSLVVDIDP